MGLRGPAPKPTALKIAAGNPGKRRLNTAEPVPAAGIAEPPEWLGSEARKVWFQLVPRLARSGLARSLDDIALGRYCTLLSRWLAAKALCEQKGEDYVVKDRHGRPVRSVEFPHARRVRLLHPALMQLEREFGLTPASRTRIRLEQEDAAKGDVNELKRNFFSFVRPPARSA